MSRAGHLLLLVWLAYVAIIDMRHREITNWATVPPLLAVTIWRSLTGGYPIGLAMAFILIAAQWSWAIAPALCGLGFCLWIATPMALDVTIGVWILCFLLWHFDVIGGADAKVVMTLTAVFPDERLAWLLLMSWFGVSMFYLVRKYGRKTPRILLTAGWNLLRLRPLPSSEASVSYSRHPALPAVALAGLVYLVVN